MLKRWQHLTLIGLGVLVCCLVAVNMSLVLANRSAQSEVQSRAQFIQQAAQLEVLYREIVKALADLSVKQQDPELRSLLGAHGITVTVNNPPAPSATEAKKGAK